MSERRSFTPEQQLKSREEYSMDKLEIEAITEPIKLPGKMGKFDWPLELLGKATTNEIDKSLMVRYPRGDIFLSYVTSIHELGHLRQHELNSNLNMDPNSHENLVASEQDAWERGWSRLCKSDPEFLKKLEEKMEFYKGALPISSFEELYKWVQNGILHFVEAQRVLKEQTFKTEIKKYNRLASEWEKAGIQKFLKEYKALYVYEKVDQNEMAVFIKNMVKNIIKEK